MNNDEKALARRQFKLKIHESNGQAFEDLFTQIMGYAEPEYRPVRPHGNIGDKHNDGYINSRGAYYQVYAPQDGGKNHRNVITKLNTDFNGIMDEWTDVKEFNFVINDKYQGLSPECYATMDDLHKKHKISKAEFVIAQDLENILFSLTDDEIITVAGNLPDPATITLDYSILSEIINHLMKIDLQQASDSTIIAPEWDAKIEFNDLPAKEARYLENGNMQIGNLDEYLDNNSNFFAEDIKKKLRDIYHSYKNKHHGKELFWEIVDEISDRTSQISYQSATITLMSKYFESCDIFEKPE